MKKIHHLFAPPPGSPTAPPRQFSVLRKTGQPFLYLPHEPALARATLQLYPAQTPMSRLMVGGSTAMIQLRIPLTAESVAFPVSAQSEFGSFLMKHLPGGEVPRFGVLSGNHKSPGRRYTLLLFDAEARPRFVVKLGLTPKARGLIKREYDFFSKLSARFPGLPELVDYHQSSHGDAIMYRYVEGKPPRLREQQEMGRLLESWIHEGEAVPMASLPAWKNLETLREDNPSLESILEKVAQTPVTPVLSHGDFAPWNIRVSPDAGGDKWVAVDWESGCDRGIPGFDWLHYLILSEVMVRRTSIDSILSKLRNLWESPEFLRYARRTGIEPIIRELNLVYFLQLLRHFGPLDHLSALNRLVRKFLKVYFPGLELSLTPYTISVVTPSYKQFPWLRLCIASVEDQENIRVQQIVQDAQSGLELESWVLQNSRAQLFVESDNGMYDAIERGFARATGDILCWLNSDEQYLEGSLEKVSRYFAAHPEIDVLFGDALLVSNTGKLLSYRRTVLPQLRHIQLSHLNTLSCATFVRRSVIERGFHLELRWKALADAVWVASLLEADIPMAVLHEPLSVFTVTDKNLGQSSLALAEAQRWQDETCGKWKWLRPLVVARHRLTKLLEGAYWPRTIRARIYTLASPKERVVLEESFLGFKWPH